MRGTWYENEIFLSALKITAWPGFHPCNSNIKTLDVYSLLCRFFYFAPPKVMRKQLENVCLRSFLLKKKTQKKLQQTNQQKESSSCSLKQQMLPLTLGFKGKSILVYMSWISWICQYEGSSWEWGLWKIWMVGGEKSVCTAVAKEMVVLSPAPFQFTNIQGLKIIIIIVLGFYYF